MEKYKFTLNKKMESKINDASTIEEKVDIVMQYIPTNKSFHKDDVAVSLFGALACYYSLLHYDEGKNEAYYEHLYSSFILSYLDFSDYLGLERPATANRNSQA